MEAMDVGENHSPVDHYMSEPDGLSQLPEDGMTRRDFAAYIRRLASIEVDRLAEPSPFPDSLHYIEGRVSALLALSERVRAGQVDPEDHPALPLVPPNFREFLHGE